MENEKLNKLQQVALEMLKRKIDTINYDADEQTERIERACDFAAMFISISEDPEMTWNKS